MQASTLTAVGRIVVASLQSFETECFQREAVPPLGALAATLDGGGAGGPIYGVVSSILTQGIDPSRPIAPHGTADEDLPTVMSRHPQLPVLLRTTFSSLVVGYEDELTLYHGLPDLPAPLVARVRICPPEEHYRFARRFDFLEQLVAETGSLTDEVAAAFLRRASRAAPEPRRFLLEAGRALVPQVARDPDRLAALLRRIRPEI